MQTVYVKTICAEVRIYVTIGGNSNRRQSCVGFVILTWNSENVITKCLKSIVDLHDITPLVVVIDNGSKDNTPDILRTYKQNYPCIFTIITYSTNKGTTISRNAGLRHLASCDCDYYCVLDSDTEINDSAFFKLIDEMEKHPEYGIIGPAMKNSSGTLQMSARCFPTLLEKLCKAVPVKSIQRIGERMEVQNPPSPDAVSWPVDYLLSACWLMRPEMLQRVGFLDEKIFYAPEDTDYCIRVWQAGWQIAYCPQAVIIHEYQRISKKKFFSRMNWEHLKGLAYMFMKHRYLFSAKKLKSSFRRQEV